MNHDGKALNGSSRASAGVGSGSSHSCASAAAGPAARSFLAHAAHQLAIAHPRHRPSLVLLRRHVAAAKIRVIRPNNRKRTLIGILICINAVSEHTW